VRKSPLLAVPAVLVVVIGLAILAAGVSVARQSEATPEGTPCPSPVGSPEATPDGTPVMPPVASPVASPDASAMDECAPAGGITIEANDSFTFTPSEITIPANTDVEITLINTGVLPHDFTVDEANVKITAEGGQQATGTINLPPGTYEFYCSVPGHRESGMVGTLIVQ